MKLFGLEIKRALKPNGESDGEGCYCNDALLFGRLRQSNAAMNLSTVFRCVDLIADSVAMLPIQVMKVDANDCKTVNKTHSLNMVLKDGIANNLTPYHFKRLLIQSVLLKGNGFALIERAGDGTVTGLRFVESGDVNIHYVSQKNNSLYYTCNLIPNKKIEPCNIIHLRKYSNDGVNGKSVLSYMERTIKLAAAGEQQATQFYTSGCNLSGVLTVDGTLTQKQRQQIHETWNQSMANGGDGLAILQGNMHYTPISVNAADAQLLESRLFQVDEICRWFGISPVLVGDLSHTQYNTLEAAQQEFILHTLSSYVQMVEEEFTKKLFKPSEPNLRINLDENAILRTDKTAVANYYQTLIKNGILCINEARKELGYNEIEGGDKHIIPYNDTIKSQITDSPVSEQITNNDNNDGTKTV